MQIIFRLVGEDRVERIPFLAFLILQKSDDRFDTLIVEGCYPDNIKTVHIILRFAGRLLGIDFWQTGFFTEATPLYAFWSSDHGQKLALNYFRFKTSGAGSLDDLKSAMCEGSEVYDSETEEEDDRNSPSKTSEGRLRSVFDSGDTEWDETVTFLCTTMSTESALVPRPFPLALSAKTPTPTDDAFVPTPVDSLVRPPTLAEGPIACSDVDNAEGRRSAVRDLSSPSQSGQPPTPSGLLESQVESAGEAPMDVDVVGVGDHAGTSLPSHQIKGSVPWRDQAQPINESSNESTAPAPQDDPETTSCLPTATIEVDQPLSTDEPSTETIEAVPADDLEPTSQPPMAINEEAVSMGERSKTDDTQNRTPLVRHSDVILD